MNTSTQFRATRFMKLAAAASIVAFLVAAGWSAEKVYESLAKKYYHVDLEGWSTLVPEDALPDAAEKAKKHHQEIKPLIAQKKYKLIKTFEFPPGGRKHYVYEFTFADGDKVGMNFALPLDNVVSWEDYLQKSREQQNQRNDQISRAIAAGNFRLLDLEAMSTHVCTGADSSQKLLVQRIVLPDGEEVASIRAEGEKLPEFQTSWQDHLQEIRQGRRVLLDLQIVENFTYELTLDDGSTTVFNYGGGSGRLLEKLTPEDVARMLGQSDRRASGEDR